MKLAEVFRANSPYPSVLRKNKQKCSHADPNRGLVMTITEMRVIRSTNDKIGYIEGRHGDHAPIMEYSVNTSRISDGKASAILYSVPLDTQGLYKTLGIT